MLGIDPGENSLSLPPPGLGTSEVAPGEQRGRLLEVVGLSKAQRAILDPGDGQKDSRERVLAEPRGCRCWDVSQREASKSRLLDRRERKKQDPNQNMIFLAP